MGKYVIDRYKNPAVETIRNHQIISTFEDLELEKLLLKDENADMKDKVGSYGETSDMISELSLGALFVE